MYEACKCHVMRNIHQYHAARLAIWHVNVPCKLFTWHVMWGVCQYHAARLAIWHVIKVLTSIAVKKEFQPLYAYYFLTHIFREPTRLWVYFAFLINLLNTRWSTHDLVLARILFLLLFRECARKIITKARSTITSRNLLTSYLFLQIARELMAVDEMILSNT